MDGRRRVITNNDRNSGGEKKYNRNNYVQNTDARVHDIMIDWRQQRGFFVFLKTVSARNNISQCVVHNENILINVIR